MELLFEKTSSNIFKFFLFSGCFSISIIFTDVREGGGSSFRGLFGGVSEVDFKEFNDSSLHL